MQSSLVANYCLYCGHALELRLIDMVERRICPACEWVHYDDPKVATGSLIFNDKNEVLLVCRSIDPIGKWVFPGGYMDRFEDPEPSARREVKEETGLDVEIASLLGIYRSPESPVMVLVYMAQITADSPPPAALHECQDVAYFSFQKIPWDELAFAITAPVLRDGFHGRLNHL